jgi:hypothetical protein
LLRRAASRRFDEVHATSETSAPTWPYYLPIVVGAASTALLLSSILDAPQWQSQSWPLWIAGACLVVAAVGGASVFASAVAVVLACDRFDSRRVRLLRGAVAKPSRSRQHRGARAGRSADWSLHFEMAHGEHGRHARLWGSVWLWLDQPARGMVETSGWRDASAPGICTLLATAAEALPPRRVRADLAATECDRLLVLARNVATMEIASSGADGSGHGLYRAVVRRCDHRTTIVLRGGLADVGARDQRAAARLQQALLAIAERASALQPTASGSAREFTRPSRIRHRPVPVGE